MDHDIDMDLLISLVENRPVLWDKTTESYKNKHLNFAAWKEICTILHEQFETLSDKEKNEFGKQVIKKWSNARDNWMRCAKKMKDYKSGSEAKSITKYKFYEQMQFLNKITTHRLTETNMPPAEDAVGTAVKDASAVPKKRKKKEVPQKNELGTRITSLVESVEKEDNSRIMSFFRGIAPTIEKFSDADIVEFQYEVIKAMRNINQRNLQQHQLQSQAYYYQNTTSMPYHSQPSQNNINPSTYGGFRSTAATSPTNYSEKALNGSREYETLNARRIFSPVAEHSRGSSIDSLDTAVSQGNTDFDFDFAKSPMSN